MMKNTNQTKEADHISEKEPKQSKPTSPAKQPQTEKAKVKQAAKEATQEALDSGEAPA